MTWSIVGVGSVVEVTATTHTLTEPASCAAGDLLVACIASRIATTTAITLPSGWTRATDQRINNVVLGTTGQASGCIAYIVRGASAPALGFTHPSAPNVARGQIVAYRENTVGGVITLDAVAAGATATAITAISIASSGTTSAANDLFVGMIAGGSAATYSAFKTANAPSTASGATNTSSTPSTTTWTERADASSATGADIGLSVFDAVKTATGAGGAVTATASVSSGHSVVMAAFQALVPTADAWNSSDKSGSGIPLSNSDKTATTAGASGGVRSTQKYANETAGKYYAEFKIDTVLSTGSRVGIIPATTAFPSTTSSVAVRTFDGTIQISASNTGLTVGATPVDNDIICMAWDAGAERIWFRLNSGLWNNDAGADPAAGTNGLDISATIGAVSTGLYLGSQAVGQVVTVRTELAEYTQTFPSGFKSWMGETPPRILTAVAGSYALTGADVTLTKAGGGPIAYTLPAVAGSYALTGATAGLYLGREVLAVAGSYALTGTATSLEYGREAAAVPGSYALSGAATSLELGKEVLAVAGSYALTGTAATLRYARRPVATAGSYSLTGTAATLTKAVNRIVAAAPGSYNLTGSAATLLHGWKAAAVAGSYALTGAAASLEFGREVLAAGGSYALAGTAATFRRAWRTTAIAGAYSLTGTASTFRRTWKTTAASGGYALTGTPVNLLKPGAYAIIGLPGFYAVSGSAATLLKSELAGLISVWNGSAWVDKPAKVWTGSAWMQKPVKHWTGSAWV